MKFLADANVGKLVRLLRILGYDALPFQGSDDNSLIAQALSQGRAILTKDHQLPQRRLATSGRLKVLLIQSDNPEEQLQQVVQAFHLNSLNPFSRCLECNETLLPRTREEVEGRVPPYVYQTQREFKECPSCHRLFWRGTHWQHMTQQLGLR